MSDRPYPRQSAPSATFAGPLGRPPPQVVAALACPVCAAPVTVTDRALRCPSGHSFDIARQGYVNLLRGRLRATTADDAAMVQAREAFLAAGHFAGVADLLAGEAARCAPADGIVIDAGAGTGYYLARVLDRLPQAWGLALDLSVPAQRRSARAHPRAGAVVCDLWERWPVRDGVAAVLLNVFAPRNAGEFRRVLRDNGVLLVVTPAPDHLVEVLPVHGGISVDPRKDERLAASLSPHFRLEQQRRYRTRRTLPPADLERLLRMGPAAHHRVHHDPAPDSTPVTISTKLSLYRPR